MNARLRLVKEDGSLASVRDLMKSPEFVALEGRVVAFTSVDVESQASIDWEAGTPEQQERDV